jgi:tetratricopeptide (TPR) repeat protein
MGWVQYRLGNHQKAIEYLQRAYDIEHDPEVAAHLGELLWISGKKAKSKSLLHKAIDSSPDNVMLQQVIKKLLP